MPRPRKEVVIAIGGRRRSSPRCRRHIAVKLRLMLGTVELIPTWMIIVGAAESGPLKLGRPFAMLASL